MSSNAPCLVDSEGLAEKALLTVGDSQTRDSQLVKVPRRNDCYVFAKTSEAQGMGRQWEPKDVVGCCHLIGHVSCDQEHTVNVTCLL